MSNFQNNNNKVRSQSQKNAHRISISGQSGVESLLFLVFYITSYAHENIVSFATSW